jgi:hypothetical protein
MRITHRKLVYPSTRVARIEDEPVPADEVLGVPVADEGVVDRVVEKRRRHRQQQHERRREDDGAR